MRFTEILYAMQRKQLVEQFVSHTTDADRPRLSIRHIQALRRLRDRHAIERDAHREFVHIMYAIPADEADAEKPKQNDQWQKKQSKAAMRAIKAKQKEHEKNAKEVQSDIKERRKKAAARVVKDNQRE